MPGLLTQQDGDVDSDNKDEEEDKEEDDNDDDAAADEGDATTTVENATPAEVLLLVDAANGFNNLRVWA